MCLTARQHCARGGKTRQMEEEEAGNVHTDHIIIILINQHVIIISITS
jgi:hypothetical protein